MIDYWKTYHQLQLKYDYDIPDFIDKRFKEKVSENLNKFAINLRYLQYENWSINVFYKKTKHFYRLKVKYKKNDICSYYLDDNQVKRNGNNCNKIPKLIDQFLVQVVSNCWKTIITIINNRENVYEYLTYLIWQFRDRKQINKC